MLMLKMSRTAEGCPLWFICIVLRKIVQCIVLVPLSIREIENCADEVTFTQPPRHVTLATPPLLMSIYGSGYKMLIQIEYQVVYIVLLGLSSYITKNARVSFLPPPQPVR